MTSTNSTATDDPLVSTQWLADHLNDPKVRVIDASFKLPGVLPLPVDDFLAAHIPGAAFFDVDAVSDHDSPLPHMYPGEQQFARDVGDLGISSDNLVVAYDSGGWMAAPRAWWMFLSFGHTNIKVLDGGLQKWRAEHRPVQSGPVSPKPGQFSATFNPSSIRSKDQLVDNLASQREQMIDARARNRFAGTVTEPRPGLRSGHIPSSLNLPYNELIDARNGTMKSVEELKQLFGNEGLDLARPVVTSCGSGVSAAVLTLALYRIGVRGTALYDGSWTEWGQADGPPIATGAA
ncbi:3-mercaptopyruvate sulfurtransferase [Bradyrhizobium prioriisuperbiae]|uniref:3-mercaptopyruvate sulfurtransferase n=1 Tax=Bradyrhizobium prioriisuperbiae TaxID=2854389 RepID=UPI0028EE9D72|nr:3-mercaptopyruvate sulfurtransferase [Bradyrhizobium prioritasuperba]